MKLVKDNSVGGWAVQVECVGRDHEEIKRAKNVRWISRWFTLAEGYADLDGREFVDYYCDDCVNAARKGK